MEIKEYIGQYNFLQANDVSAFLRTFNEVAEFKDAEVSKNGDNIVDKNTRDVKNYSLSINKSLTEAHWLNYICSCLEKISLKYFTERNINYRLRKIEVLNLLKYPEKGFYKKHHDSGDTHRELSAVVFLNNDYEGGHLQFFNPKTEEIILDIKPEVGKIVLWPSNFMFPHQATTVTKGTRFSLVSWMI
jgi:predicted 2-oxoglutarate/Fe(II)-dependent dioxygenase YbiX